MSLDGAVWQLFVEKLIVFVIPGNTERFGVAAGLSVHSLEVRSLNLAWYTGCLRFL
jgi:hypothetical protein